MAFDIPQLRLYKGGKVVQQYPLSEGEARRKMRRERSAKLEEDLGVKDGAIESEDGSDDGADSDAESEDEREVQRIRDMSRFKWDRSAVGWPCNSSYARSADEFCLTGGYRAHLPPARTSTSPFAKFVGSAQCRFTTTRDRYISGQEDLHEPQHRSNTLNNASRLVASTISFLSSRSGGTRYCLAAGKRTCWIMRFCASTWSCEGGVRGAVGEGAGE